MSMDLRTKLAFKSLESLDSSPSAKLCIDRSSKDFNSSVVNSIGESSSLFLLVFVRKKKDFFSFFTWASAMSLQSIKPQMDTVRSCSMSTNCVASFSDKGSSQEHAL